MGAESLRTIGALSYPDDIISIQIGSNLFKKNPLFANPGGLFTTPGGLFAAPRLFSSKLFAGAGGPFAMLRVFNSIRQPVSFSNSNLPFMTDSLDLSTW